MRTKKVATNKKEMDKQFEELIKNIEENKKKGKPSLILMFTVDLDGKGHKETHKLEIVRQKLSPQMAIAMLELGKHQLLNELDKAGDRK